MLQQTQVSRVIEHYERWVDRYPTAADLAAAPLSEVLAAWQGLGYPVRARRLREAAVMVSEGAWPGNAEGLETLPGVGPYTAAAVASIAMGEKVAVVDTNVKRVLSRWVGEPLDGAELRSEAAVNMTGDAGTWNQAVMELGALVCRPNPACEVCPVARWCADPSIYVPPPKQPRFDGSDRQVRGAVLRAVVEEGAADEAHLIETTNYPPERVRQAVTTLVGDELLRIHDGAITPAG
ncbi:A/G-specific adenine glycosylase [bacterium]|nr:A/G-specific adenine glycosylase [bacterium]